MKKTISIIFLLLTTFVSASADTDYVNSRLKEEESKLEKLEKELKNINEADSAVATAISKLNDDEQTIRKAHKADFEGLELHTKKLKEAQEEAAEQKEKVEDLNVSMLRQIEVKNNILVAIFNKSEAISVAKASDPAFELDKQAVQKFSDSAVELKAKINAVDLLSPEIKTLKEKIVGLEHAIEVEYKKIKDIVLTVQLLKEEGKTEGEAWDAVQAKVSEKCTEYSDQMKTLAERKEDLTAKQEEFTKKYTETLKEANKFALEHSNTPNPILKAIGGEKCKLYFETKDQMIETETNLVQTKKDVEAAKENLKKAEEEVKEKQKKYDETKSEEDKKALDEAVEQRNTVKKELIAFESKESELTDKLVDIASKLTERQKEAFSYLKTISTNFPEKDKIEGDAEKVLKEVESSMVGYTDSVQKNVELAKQIEEETRSLTRSNAAVEAEESKVSAFKTKVDGYNKEIEELKEKDYSLNEEDKLKFKSYWEKKAELKAVEAKIAQLKEIFVKDEESSGFWFYFLLVCGIVFVAGIIAYCIYTRRRANLDTSVESKNRYLAEIA